MSVKKMIIECKYCHRGIECSRSQCKTVQRYPTMWPCKVYEYCFFELKVGEQKNYMTFDDFLTDNYVVTSASRDDSGGFYVHFMPKLDYLYKKVDTKEGDEDE